MEMNHIWSGLIGVKPLYEDTCIPEDCGAWVQTIAKARDREDFLKVITHFYMEMEFEVFDSENIMPLSDSISAGCTAGELTAKAHLLEKFGDVQFDGGHEFPVRYAHA